MRKAEINRYNAIFTLSFRTDSKQDWTLCEPNNHFVFMTTFCRRPRWLSWMRVRLVIRRLRVRPPPGREHSFMEIDHEIFSTVILSLTLIQEGQFSVSNEKMCSILVKRLEDCTCPVNWPRSIWPHWVDRVVKPQQKQTKQHLVLEWRFDTSKIDFNPCPAE